MNKKFEYWFEEITWWIFVACCFGIFYQVGLFIAEFLLDLLSCSEK
jgi:hypothetical protein